MKSLILALLVGFTTVTADRTYMYNYAATSVSGVPGTSDNSTGIQMNMTVAITFSSNTRVALQITQCTTDAFIGKYPNENVTLFHEEKITDCNKLKARRLSFDYFKGRVTKIYPSVEESIHTVNIKRGILSAFQYVPLREDGDFTEQQTDVLGNCIVQVQKSSTAEGVYLVQKRDTENCLNRLTEFSTILPISKHQEAKFVFGETTTQMTLKFEEGRDLILERSEVIEKQSFAPVSKDAGSASVTLSQVLFRNQTLENSTSLPRSTSSMNGPPKTLVFDYPPAAKCEQQTKGLCSPDPIIETMTTLEDPIEIAVKFAALLEETRKCSRDRLQGLMRTYLDQTCRRPRGVLEGENRKQTYFLDALAWVGTGPAIDVIFELARSYDQCLSGSRLRGLIVSLSFVPLRRFCSPCWFLHIVQEIANLNKESMTSTLVLGTVVQSVLKHPKYTCGHEIDKSIEWLLKKYRETDDIKEKIYVLKAIGNTGSLRGISALEHSLSETAETTDELNFERRLAAIYALQDMASVAPAKINSILLNIYKNENEEVEARVAAFLVYFRSPSIPSSHFVELVRSLHKEPNSYVKSFVYTYLSAIETSDNPHTASRKEAISYIMRVTNIHYWCKGCDLGYFSSKATRNYISLADAYWTRSLPRDVMGIDLSTEFVYTSASSLPRSGMAKLTVNAFGYDFDAIEVGVRARGTDRLMQHLFGPTGISLGTRILKQSGFPGKEKMCYPEQEPMWFAGYIKVLGNELSWIRVDEKTINNILYSETANGLRQMITESVMSHFDFSVYGRIRDYFWYIVTGKLNIARSDINVNKSATILDVERTIPTVLGLPLKLSASATVSTQMDVNGQLSATSSTTLRAEGTIKPQAAVYANVTFVLDAGSVQPRLVHIGTVKTSFKQQGMLDLRIANDYSSVSMLDLQMLSQPESVVFEAKYRQYCEVHKKSLEMGIWKRNETELYERFGGNLTDLEFITPISYPNSTDVPAAPIFPLSGPAEAKLVLRHLSQNRVAHRIKIWNNNNVFSPERGTFYGTFEKNQEKTIDAKFDWYTVGERPTQWRVVNLTATSTPVNASALFRSSTSRIMDTEGWMNLNTSISTTRSHVKFNRSHFYGTAIRKRVAPNNESVVIKIPEFFCQINGSLVNSMQGNVSAILYLEASDKPQWLRANFKAAGMMVDIAGESSKFKINTGYILSYPWKSPGCTYFDQHVITFDGLSYPIMTPQCEYILVRHLNESDNFVVVAKNGGEHLDVYINATKYTLKNWSLEINDVETHMPYIVRHEIQIGEVTVGSHEFIRLSAWVGLDIYYNGEGAHLSINGLYRNQTSGLCGNANDNDSRRDEMETPACQVAESTQDFVTSWAVGNSCLASSTPDPPVDEQALIEARHTCDPLFTEEITQAYFAIAHTPYLDTCIHDVSTGRSPVGSLKAYIMAAALNHVAIEVAGVPGLDVGNHTLETP